MVNKRLVQEWLDKADEDFEFALRNLNDDGNVFLCSNMFSLSASR
jgi:hypothetical protein